MSNLKEDIVDTTLDALKEISNMGAGNAITALSQMLSTKINMDVVEVEVKEVSDVVDMFVEEDRFMVANLIEIVLGMRAVLLLLFEEESAKEVVNKVLGYRPEDIRNVSDMERSLLMELGNILGGSYLNAVGTFLEQEIDQSTPQLVMDMASAIITMPAIELCDENQDTIIIQSRFEDSENLLKGTYIFILDKETEMSIIKSVGKYYEGHH